MRYFVMWLAAVMFLPSGAALAQRPADLKVGDRVRVTATEFGRRESVLVGLSGDTIVFRDAGVEGVMWTIQYGQVQRFEVLRPGAGSHAGEGTALGLIGGAMLVGAVGFVITQCDNCDGESGIGALLAVPGAVIGAIAGGLVGWSVRTDGWQRLRFPLRVTAGRSGSRSGTGPGFSVRLTF